MELLAVNTKLLAVNNRLLRSREGIYTIWELNDMILNQGYIPVATESELGNFRLTGSRTMGAGTLWQGTYTTGLDKKYVQVKTINMVSVYAHNTGFSGVYDGNGLWINNFQATVAFIWIMNTGGHVLNMKVKGEIDCLSGGGSNGRSFIVAEIAAGSIVENCYAYGTIINGAHLVAGIAGINKGKIKNCYADVKITSTSVRAGGLVCQNQGTVTDSICKAIINTTSITTTGQGCFVANNTGTIERCAAISSSITTPIRNTGGFVGYNDNVIKDSYCEAVVTCPGGQPFIGGFVGSNAASTSEIYRCYGVTTLISSASGTQRAWGGFCGGNYGNALIQDSYVRGNMTAANNGGGFTGQIGSGGSRHINCYAVTSLGSTGNWAGFTNLMSTGTHVATNCYFDSTVAGTTTTANGLARTTPQMKEGTKDSFILPAGGTDPNSLAANAMYTSWDTAIWDFLTTADYPVLK